MKNRRLRNAFLVLLALSVVASAYAQEKYLLQYKFQKGKTYRYRVVSNNDITQEMQGQEMKMTNMTTTIARLVTDNVLEGGSMIMIVSSDTMVTRAKNPRMDTTMVLKNMMGKRMKITLDRRGEVRSREVLDSVQFDTRGMNVRVPQRETIGFTRLPDHEVKVSEKWNDSKTDTTEAAGGKMMNALDVEYSVVGKESKMGHDCLKISYIGKTSTNGKMNQMGMDLYIEGTGKVSGTFFFDHAQGILVYDESLTDMESTVAVSGQQNMTIPMTTSSKTVRELLGD